MSLDNYHQPHSEQLCNTPHHQADLSVKKLITAHGGSELLKLALEHVELNQSNGVGISLTDETQFPPQWQVDIHPNTEMVDYKLLGSEGSVCKRRLLKILAIYDADYPKSEQA